MNSRLRIWRREDATAVAAEALAPLSALLLFAAVVWLDLLTGEAGALSTGDFVAFFGLFVLLMQGLALLGMTAVGMAHVVAQAGRVRPILEEAPERSRGLMVCPALRGRVEMRDVSFRYHDTAPWVLDGLCLEANPGEMIALVGPSGCGKSTVFRLLLGFELPRSGSVHYDDVDLAEFDVRSVRRHIGVVLQASALPAGNIKTVVGAGGDVNPANVTEALKLAAFFDEVNKLPMGTHTIVTGGGENFSGGQRQRLAIARALVRKPRILLLDEATSALDNKTQAEVGRNLTAQKVTRVVIAHRLSTIRNADRIYVLDAGKVIQQGTFAELMAEPGLFQDMARLQLA